MTSQVDSSWIAAILYRVAPDGTRWLGVLTRQGKILLYGPDLSPTPTLEHPSGPPSWLLGLLCAGVGGESVGRAYNRLMKGSKDENGEWQPGPYGFAQTISDPAEVEELKRLMEVVK